MAAAITRRLLPLSRLKPLLPNPSLLLPSRSLSSPLSPPQNPNPGSPGGPPPSTEPRSRAWTSLLRPGFTPSDVEEALLSHESDPDLALDLFRWTSMTPHYRHTPSTYLSVLRILLRARRLSSAEPLLLEVLSGACPPHLPLFNLLLHFTSRRRHLFSVSFDLYKKLLSPSSPCRPDLETYSILLSMLLRRFGKPPVNYIHLHAVRSLVRQMKALGVIPDTFLLNLIVKAYSKCLEMDEAARVFREMGLYNCEPNEYTYGYIAKGMCEKGRVRDGVRYFREMREKGFVATGSVYMTVVCSLAMEKRFEEAREVVEDMLENGRKPDLLTYRTFLEGLCREGRGDEAMKMLEEFGRRKGAMDRRMYSDLLDGLHWLNQPHD